jgi:hypothetical protein
MLENGLNIATIQPVLRCFRRGRQYAHADQQTEDAIGAKHALAKPTNLAMRLIEGYTNGLYWPSFEQATQPRF